MKGKIGEAMAYGLPVVTTTIGAEGMDLRHGVDVLIADTPEAFAENVARLVQDTNLWDSISHNARQRLAKEWSPDAVDRKLTDILARASGLQVATGKLS
jgi:glycosyltransferase involved in cell wall biosynthesis